MSSVVSGVSSAGSTSTVGKETVVEVEVKKVGGTVPANPGVTLARLTGCILYVRNLPFNMKTEAIVDIFEKFVKFSNFLNFQNLSFEIIPPPAQGRNFQIFRIC